MSEEVLIKVEGLSKKFCKDLKLSLKYGLQDLGSEVFGRERHKELRPKEFWAIDNVSFELKRGECLGLIGRNGAGKSTLLKMLNGLIKPDAGKIEMHGRVAALIELGAGFNPILTGRENIYNNAAVLGFKKKEIDDLYDEIVEFSEIAEYMNTPVQYYSSGMKVRLGFSVAVHIRPDILILDEVLAVGDAGFKMKSLNKMYELMRSCSVIFVNHSMSVISRVSNKLLYMEKGKVKYFGGDMIAGTDMYFDTLDGGKPSVELEENARVLEASIYSDSVGYDAAQQMNGKLPVFNYLDDLYLKLRFSVDHSIDKFRLWLAINNKDLITVAKVLTPPIHNPKAPTSVIVKIPKIQLGTGEYDMSLNVISESMNKQIHYATYRRWVKFKIKGESFLLDCPFMLSNELIEVND